MSNEDSFINEVTEEVRRDKLFKMFRRYGWIGVLAIVLIVGGAALNEWRKARAAGEAQAAGDAILAALEHEDATQRADALAALASDNQSRAAVLELLAADAAMDDGNLADAIAKLEALANNTSAPTPFRDLATIKAVIVGAGTLAPEERIARMNALSLGASAFRLAAMEQIALAEIELGETEAAIARLREIVADAAVTQDLRRRASQLIVALGGALTAG